MNKVLESHIFKATSPKLLDLQEYGLHHIIALNIKCLKIDCLLYMQLSWQFLLCLLLQQFNSTVV